MTKVERVTLDRIVEVESWLAKYRDTDWVEVEVGEYRALLALARAGPALGVSGDGLMTTLATDDSLFVAWEKYRTTDEYANTRSWAKHDEHLDGSLWAAFMEGWFARDLLARPPEDVQEETAP